MIKYIIYKDDSVKEGVNIALKNRLFVSGWSLNGDLKEAKNCTENKKISIAFENNIPIGVAFDDGTQIEAFVRKSKRRKGIGSKLVNLVKTENSKAGIGLKMGQSEKFWKKNNVEIDSYWKGVL